MDSQQIGPADRKRSLGLRALLVLVAAFGLLIWATISIRETLAPAERWARLLRTGSVEQRREAAGELTHLQPRDLSVAIPALARALSDEDEQVAVLASASLTAAARLAFRSRDFDWSQAATIGLTHGLKDPRVEVRKAAAAGLAAVQGGMASDDSLNNALVSALSDASFEVRASATRALAVRGTVDKHLTNLLSVLATDVSPQVRREAALAIGQTTLGYDPATMALLNGLEHGEPTVSDACNSALFRLNGGKNGRRSGAIVSQLIQALNSTDDRVRTHAAACLGEIGPYAETSISALLVVMNESVPTASTPRNAGDPIRWNPPGQAALALGQIAPDSPRAQDVARAIVEHLRTEKNDKLRATAAEGLAGFAPDLIEPALPVLLAGLKGSIRQPNPPAPSFCYAIGRADPNSPLADQAVALLAAALDSKDPDTQAQAARAISRFGARSRSALPRLKALAESKDAPWVQQPAAASIILIENAVQATSP